jgi:CubicO group peptidase (beta-lactamase class C family)
MRNSTTNDFKMLAFIPDYNNGLHHLTPVFAPQTESSYSNVGFDLLGQVISKVTGVTYEHHITETIFKPLELHATSFEAPANSTAASAGPDSDWGHDEGAGNP